jgi:hypothetical protein
VYISKRRRRVGKTEAQLDMFTKTSMSGDPRSTITAVLVWDGSRSRSSCSCSCSIISIYVLARR